MPLTPRNFDLLVFLVEHSGRLVSKDQIFEAVWHGSFVEEANLTVSIANLRKTLGERPGGLPYIETVPKKGYRFTAPVREVSSLKDGVAQPTLDKAVIAPAESVQSNGDSPRAVVALVQPTFETGSPKSADTIPSVAVREKPGISRIALVSLLLVVSVLAGLGSYLYLRKQSSARVPPVTRSLAILPFQNLRRDPNEDFLGFSLADAVITKLGYVSSLTVRPSAAVQKYRDQVIDIPKVAADLNVDTLLTGNFIRDGDDLRITYQLVDAKTDKIIDRGMVDSEV